MTTATISHRKNSTQPDTSWSERFWQRVDIGSTSECWEWKHRRNQAGYGMFAIKGVDFRAHRVMWTMFNGRDLGELLVRHSCDNPPCVNPHHLLSGTHKDNAEDASERDRWNRNRTHCKQGHLLTEAGLFARKSRTGQNHGRCKVCTAQYAKAKRAKDKMLGRGKFNPINRERYNAHCRHLRATRNQLREIAERFASACHDDLLLAGGMK